MIEMLLAILAFGLLFYGVSLFRLYRWKRQVEYQLDQVPLVATPEREKGLEPAPLYEFEIAAEEDTEPIPVLPDAPSWESELPSIMKRLAQQEQEAAVAQARIPKSAQDVRPASRASKPNAAAREHIRRVLNRREQG